MRPFLLAAAFFAAFPLAAQAQQMVQSQEGIALQNQIYQLQQQMQQLQSSGGGGGGSSLGGNSSPPPDDSGNNAPPSSITTSLLGQVQQLQTQVQQLNGRVDTLQNQMTTQNAAMQKEIDDMKFQLGNGAAGSPPAPGAPPPGNAPQQPGQASASPPPASVSPASPKIALHTAQTAIAHHDYATAESNARGILATAKTSPEGYQAQFILGQALYGEGHPQDAAIAYDDSYNRARNGSNAAASLLGLANSLTAINQASEACDTLAALNSQFPTPPKGLGPEIMAAGRRAHCS